MQDGVRAPLTVQPHPVVFNHDVSLGHLDCVARLQRYPLLGLRRAALGDLFTIKDQEQVVAADDLIDRSGGTNELRDFRKRLRQSAAG
jgi:hypothetical protein